jgi:hypothetical protein
MRWMISVGRDLIINHAAFVSISFFVALFSCSFAHGQQEEDTTSLTATGILSQPISKTTPASSRLPQLIPQPTDNIVQQQEPTIGSGVLVPSPNPSPSLPIDEELADNKLFQPQGELTSETRLDAEEEQQQLSVGEILKGPTAQKELIEEEKEEAELEIKQRLDDTGGDEVGDSQGRERGGGVAEGQNNQEDDTNNDTISGNEVPLDLQLPIPFP